MIRVTQLARLADATPKAIRYYDKLGLLKTQRTASGYREFDERTVDVVRIIRRAQLLGLQMPEIREIVDLLGHGEEPCERVRVMLQHRREDVARRIRELNAFDRFLGELETTASGREQACAILAKVNVRRKPAG